MSPRFRPPLIVALLLALSTLAALWIGAARIKVEQSRRAVHITTGLDDVRLIAASAGLDVASTLIQLKGSGLTSVVVNEETFDDLVASGKLLPIPGAQQKFACMDADLGNRLSRVAETRFRKGVRRCVIVLKNGSTIGFPLTMRELKSFGAGFDSAILQSVQKSGLSLIARVGNPPSSSGGSLQAIVEDVVRTKAEGVLFQGDQVLGWRDRVKELSVLLQNSPLWYGAIEFGNQAGDPRMTSEIVSSSNEPKILRVHSMLPAEMNQSAEPTIIDRYVRAAAERNIKVLYLRPRGSAETDSAKAFGELINQVSRGLAREGFEAKQPRLMTAPEFPRWLTWITALGGLVASVWVLSLFFTPRWVTLAGGFVAMLAFGMLLMSSDMAPKLAALIIALALPSWAVCAAFSDGAKPSSWAYLWISAISVIGGLHCAALLTDLTFMFRADQFMGVKAAHFLPPIVVGAALVIQNSSAKRALDSPMRWLDTLLMAAIGIALLLVVLRTGNDAPTAVSGWELRLRDIMDRVLPERPRTKEIMLGHPALIVALMLAARAKRRWVPLLAMFAAIGQASIVNTFCHLHTPLMTTVIRVLTGLVCGGIIGLMIWLAIKRRVAGSQSSLDLN
ncbi:MAG: DUF5693 family protein [Fimbriimonadales bacterium]